MKTAATTIACLLLVGACGKSRPLTDQEKKQVSNITADMKTRCVGRYLIDMPAGVTALGTAKVDDVLVQSEPMTYERFEELSEERDEKMRSTKSSLGYRYLYASGKVPTVAQTQYFISLGDYASSSDATRIIDAYKWDGGYQLTLKLEATDFTQSKYRDRAFMQEVPIKNNLPEKTRIVFDLISRLEGRAEDVIPTEPGACFYGGFLKGKTRGGENVNSFYALTDKPDVSLTFESYTDLRADDTLLQRVHGSRMREIFGKTNGRLIRADSILLGDGLKADEALMSVRTPTTRGVQGHLLSLEANYSGGAITPYLLLDMQNGYPNLLIESDAIRQASLTEGEAIGIWEKVSRSLRARPNAF
jgi:hypothetical protein